MVSDVRLTTRITEEVGERWERRMSERGLGKRMLYLGVIYELGKNQKRFCMWVMGKILHLLLG